MSVIRNNFSGKTHIILHGTNHTLCGMGDLDRKEEMLDWEILLSNCYASRAIRATDCKTCKKMMGELP